MLGLALGLASSVSWGISDFLGGLTTRRFSAFSVLLVSQPIGLVLAFALALTVGGSLPADQFALAAAGGMAVTLGLGAFYKGMALGSISVVATIGALGVLVPVAAGMIRGENPAAIQNVGALIAIAGVVLVAREPDPEWRQANRRSIGLAAVAALGFGLFLLLLDGAASHDAAWAVAGARVGGVSLLFAGAVVMRPGLPRASGSTLVALLAIGIFDILANSLYVVASTHGLLPVVSVAASLYAAVTVLLARFVLGERLARPQRAGVALALVGVALIAAGA
jgi:drug/metabolite transporter (DMT)-like permease